MPKGTFVKKFSVSPVRGADKNKICDRDKFVKLCLSIIHFILVELFPEYDKAAISKSNLITFCRFLFN